MAIEAVGLDTSDDFDRRWCDLLCLVEVNLPLEMLNGIPLNLNYSWSHHDDFADWLGTVRILHPGLECNLMDQYLVSLSSLLMQGRKREKIF